MMAAHEVGQKRSIDGLSGGSRNHPPAAPQSSALATRSENERLRVRKPDLNLDACERLAADVTVAEGDVANDARPADLTQPSCRGRAGPGGMARAVPPAEAIASKPRASEPTAKTYVRMPAWLGKQRPPPRPRRPPCCHMPSARHR